MQVDAGAARKGLLNGVINHSTCHVAVWRAAYRQTFEVEIGE